MGIDRIFKKGLKAVTNFGKDVIKTIAPAPLKIGVMEGFSGVYGDLTLGGVEAAQMAVDDFGGKVLGRPIEIVSADHQTKPDVGAAIARKWYDVDGVKMITGIGTSSVALAVRKIAQEKGMIDINTGAASADLTGPAQHQITALVAHLQSRGILITGLYRLRFVAHLDVDAEGIERTITAIREFLAP